MDIRKAIKKSKMVLVYLLVMVLVVIYVNTYLIAVLARLINVRTVLFGMSVIKAVYLNNTRLAVSIYALEFAGLLYLSMNKATYNTKLVEITPDIHTPAVAGENQCGSARWLPKKDYDKAFKYIILPRNVTLEKLIEMDIAEGGCVVGKEDTKEGEKIYYIDTDTHSLIVGATRSGKTRCLVLQTIGLLGLAGESIVVTDVKGELLDYTRPYLEALGYDVKVIDYDEPLYSDLWNYLQVIIDYVDANDLPAAIDATWDLTSQLVGEAKGEKIWNDGEASMIAAGIMAVVWDNRFGNRRKYRNLANVYYFLVNMCKPIGRIMPLQVYVAKLPENHPAKTLLGVSDVAPSKTRGSFYTSALMTLKLFTNPYIANMSTASSFDPADLGKKKMALFIVLPDDRLTYHQLATLLVSQTNTILSKEAKRQGGRLQNRVNFMCEELGNFSKIEGFTQMLTVDGGKGIRFNLFIQDFAQIEKVYEKTGLRTIRSNCETWIYLQSDDPETLKEISDKLDKYTTKSWSTSANQNSGKTTVSSTGSSNNLVARELLTPGEVKKIKRPYLLVTSRNDPAMMVCPDLSQWQFNRLFGMGDQEWNRKLRRERREHRTKHELPDTIEYWDITQVIISEIKKKQALKEAEKAAKEQENENTEELRSEE